MRKTNVKIRFAEKDDCDAIIKIADSQLGKNYVTKAVFEKMLSDGSFCMVAEIQKTIVGFCFCKQTDYKELKNICNGNEIEELQFVEKIGYIKTIAVNEKFKNRGIATQLLQSGLAKLKEDGAQAFFTTAWKNEDRTNIAPLLTKHGFSKKLELANFWHERSIKEKFDCPQCGNPCHCTCVIYIKV